MIKFVPYEYQPFEQFIVVSIVDEDTERNSLLGFTITDRKNQRYTQQTFPSPSSAWTWGEQNYKELQ